MTRQPYISTKTGSKAEGMDFKPATHSEIIYAFDLDSAGDCVWDTADLKEKAGDTPPKGH